MEILHCIRKFVQDMQGNLTFPLVPPPSLVGVEVVEVGVKVGVVVCEVGGLCKGWRLMR